LTRGTDTRLLFDAQIGARAALKLCCVSGLRERGRGDSDREAGGDGKR
jgi:hypothetical protein